MAILALKKSQSLLRFFLRRKVVSAASFEAERKERKRKGLTNQSQHTMQSVLPLHNIAAAVDCFDCAAVAAAAAVDGKLNKTGAEGANRFSVSKANDGHSGRKCGRRS